MPPSKANLYQAAGSDLKEIWGKSDQQIAPPQSLDFDDFRRVMLGRVLAPRYALVTQLLLKQLLGSVPIRQLKAYNNAPTGFSARSLAKNVVVPFDGDLDALLGGSQDPYVSNPLRQAALDDALKDDDPS